MEQELVSPLFVLSTISNLRRGESNRYDIVFPKMSVHFGLGFVVGDVGSK